MPITPFSGVPEQPAEVNQDDESLQALVNEDNGLGSSFAEMAPVAFSQGGTLKHGDEIGAGLQTLLHRLFGGGEGLKEDYVSAVGDNREQINRVKKDWPKAYPAIEMLGSTIPSYYASKLMGPMDSMRAAAGQGGVMGSIVGLGGSEHGVADSNYGGAAIDTLIGGLGGAAAGPAGKATGDFLAPYLQRAGVSMAQGAGNAFDRLRSKAIAEGQSKAGEHFQKFSGPMKEATRALELDQHIFGGTVGLQNHPQASQGIAARISENIDETLAKGVPPPAPPFDIAGATQTAMSNVTSPVSQAAKAGWAGVKDMIVDHGLGAAGGAAGLLLGGPEAGLAGYAGGQVANKFVKSAGRSLINAGLDPWKSAIGTGASKVTESAANYVKEALPLQISEVIASKVNKIPALAPYLEMINKSERPEVTHFVLQKNDPAYRAMMGDDSDGQQ